MDKEELYIQILNTSLKSIPPKIPVFFMPRKGGIRSGGWKEIYCKSRLFAGISKEKISPREKGDILIKGQWPF